MANRLAGATSPYLRQHADNPVDWYPWGAEALERARTLDRPIFLSIGYSACHWCHVMAHESFENPAIAARLNEHFVPIKVDREERPDLDDLYLGAVQAMTGSGGWPLSVFLTPGLEPFYGGTYFPPEDRHGLPAFGRVLDALADAWTGQRDEVVRSAGSIAEHLRHQVEARSAPAPFDQGILDQAAQRLLAAFDGTHGGFGGAPKFPAPMTLEFLLRRWARNRQPNLLEAVTVTLDRMADGGIHDQLAGGFARYSTDTEWLVPHFEKMLYDNALLAHAYLEGYRATGHERHAEVARSTFHFLLDEMETDGGGFAAALDADSEGEEGRYYVWTADEIEHVLVDGGLTIEEVAAVAAAWDVRPAGNWEGRTVLRRRAGHVLDAALEERARVALLAARRRRTAPGRDDKRIAAWNGLTLRAVAHGALVLGDVNLVAASQRLVAFITEALVHDGDRLWRVAPVEGSAPIPAFAEDYALVVDGLLEAYSALAEASVLDLAIRLTRRLVAGFWDEASGTVTDTGADHETLIARPRTLLDSATPSANAVTADVLLRLAVLTGEVEQDRRAQRILAATAGDWARQPSAFGRTLAAADRALAGPMDVVVVGSLDEPAAQTLRSTAAGPYLPNLVIAPMDPAHARSEPIFADKVSLNGEPTAYFCRGMVCLAPTTDPGTLAAQLTGSPDG